jgi:hypothetical protein
MFLRSLFELYKGSSVRIRLLFEFIGEGHEQLALDLIEIPPIKQALESVFHIGLIGFLRDEKRFRLLHRETAVTGPDLSGKLAVDSENPVRQRRAIIPKHHVLLVDS